MQIKPTEFKLECNLDELTIIHKALTILKQDVLKREKFYSKGYISKVNELIKETQKYW